MEITNSCPDCGNELEADDTCPACGWSPHAKRVVIEENDHLDQARVKRIVDERKAIYRMRTVMLVLGLALLGVAVQCIWKLVQGRHAIAREVAMIYVGILLIAFVGGIFFLLRARHYATEYRRTMLHESPISRPDFTELGDGSSVRKNLDKLKSD